LPGPSDEYRAKADLCRKRATRNPKTAHDWLDLTAQYERMALIWKAKRLQTAANRSRTADSGINEDGLKRLASYGMASNEFAAASDERGH
jgi:hypothetical protein